MIYYTTKENEVLDWICWKHYGFQSGAIEIVLEVNTHIAENGSFLPSGILLKLPLIEKPTLKPIVKLWD
jgi:phage tail protein X